jgi:hypothetical protein
LFDPVVFALGYGSDWPMTVMKGIEDQDVERLGLNRTIACISGALVSPLAAGWRTCPLPCERRAGGRAGLMPEEAGIWGVGISGSQQIPAEPSPASRRPVHSALSLPCSKLALLDAAIRKRGLCRPCSAMVSTGLSLHLAIVTKSRDQLSPIPERAGSDGLIFPITV